MPNQWGPVVVTDQLSLRFSDRWVLVPSPKMRPRDRSGLHAWTKLYSSFSDRFALAALSAIRNSTPGLVLDPFVGTGTSLVAAARLGLPAIGVELDPFSALLASASVATRASSQEVARLLRGTTGKLSHSQSALTPDLFRASDLAYARVVFDRIRTHSSFNWASLLANASHSFDSQLIALAALGIAANLSARVARGSNPVWYRPVPANEKRATPPLTAIARELAAELLEDLPPATDDALAGDVIVLNEDFRASSLRSASADLVLTSPPYPNRLDYVINHLAPLTLLNELMPINLTGLRARMMGTTKIVSKSLPNPSWGKLSLALLSAIWEHKSKASSTYYYWIYSQYFADLFATLAEVKRICRPGAKGLMVVQNSFYKELEVPVPAITVEMARNLDIDANLLREETIRIHLGTISPRQTKYLPTKVLTESILSFNF